MEIIKISNFIQYFEELEKRILDGKISLNESVDFVKEVEQILINPEIFDNVKTDVIINLISNLSDKSFDELFDYSAAESLMIRKFLNSEEVMDVLFQELYSDIVTYQTESLENENEDENPNNNSVFSQVIDILDEDSIKSTNEKVVDDYFVDGNIIYIVFGNYLFILINNNGTFEYSYNKFSFDYDDISEIISYFNYNEVKPKGDENFKSYFEMEIDIEDESNWEDIYAVIDEYNIKQEKSIQKDRLHSVMMNIANVYGAGEAIVNKLYDLDSEEADEYFGIDYPWNKSFDDLMVELFSKFNDVYFGLPDKAIIDIDRVNAITSELVNKENVSLSYLFKIFESKLQKLTDENFHSQYDDSFVANEWKIIYNNQDFKGLWEMTYWSLNMTNGDIKKYLYTQSKIPF